MIQVQGITKRFGGFAAVKNLSFDAQDRAITGLLGANGAGKTTTLRMVAGVLQADEGRISVGGADPQSDTVTAQKHLGALLDHTGLYPRLTARENLSYFAKLRRIPRATLGQRMDTVLTDLGLTDIADRRVAAFSQGEHMKVALGRALIHRPTHVLLDEPTNGLDVPTLRTLRQLLKDLRNAGTCIVFSSHVLGEVEDLCDRLVVIARGSVVGQGTVAELCAATGTQTLESAFLKLTEDKGGAKP